MSPKAASGRRVRLITKARLAFAFAVVAVLVAGSTALATTVSRASVQAGAPSHLTIAIGSPLSSLDPTKDYQHDQIAIESLYGGTLTVINQAGTQASPGLAQSWTAGPKKWIFTLRPNLTFSDGTPLTAKDVAASLNFYRTKKDGVWTYAFTEISGVHALSARKFEVDLSSANPQLYMSFAIPAAAILPASKLADKKSLQSFMNAPMSAGQYMIVSQTPTKVVLQENTHYWGSKPAVPQLTFVSVPDPAARLAQLEGNRVDVADSIQTQAAKQLSGRLHGKWYGTPLAGEYLMMNVRASAPTADLKLREAINAAIDRNQLSKVVYFGANSPQLGLVASSVRPYYHPYAAASANIGQAKSLLAQSKCKSGCKLTVTVGSSVPDEVEMAQLIAQQLNAAGIRTSVVQQDHNVFQSNLANGNFDLAIDYGQGVYINDLLDWALPSNGGGPASWAGWKGADALVQKWETQGGGVYKKAVAQALGRLAADKAFVPLVGYGFMVGTNVPDSLFSVKGGQIYVVGNKT